MITGFAAGGFVDLAPALAVMLGANFSTTLIVQALSLHVNEAAGEMLASRLRRETNAMGRGNGDCAHT